MEKGVMDNSVTVTLQNDEQLGTILSKLSSIPGTVFSGYSK